MCNVKIKDIAEACDATIKTVGQTKPVASARRYYEKGFLVYQHLYQSLCDDFKKIADLS